jgi:NADPH:quinone reductase-like Zn-dependent oxidoreductase
MSTQQAVLVSKDAQPGALTTLTEIPIPTPGDDEILVKTVAVAANPTDWKHILGKFGQPGNIVGSDGSGVVVKVGSNVKGFKEGDIVSSFIHGSFTNTYGAFAEYFLANPNATIKYDEEFFQKDKVLNSGETYPGGPIDTFEGAASVTLGLTTVVLSYAGNLNISKEDKGKYILIWGGATAAGILSIQLAKLAYGLKVITTASPKNAEFLKSIGADHVLSYHDSDVVDQIRNIAKGDIKYAIDTVAAPESFQALYDSTCDSDEVKIDNLLFRGEKDITADDRKGKVTFVDGTLAYLVDGKTPLHIFGGVFDIKKETREKYDDFWFNELPQLVPKLKTAKLKVLPNGLKNIETALDLLYQDKVSAEKVVLRV